MSIWNRPRTRRIVGAVVWCHFLLAPLAQDLGAVQFKERRAPLRQTLRSPPILFLIADSHCHYSSQKNIRDILTRLWSAGMIRAVFVEGNSVNIDTSLFAALPSDPIKKDVVDGLMKKGLVSGAESFAMERPSSPPLVGIEDPVLYIKSFRLLQKIFQNQTATRLKTTVLKERVGQRGKSHFSPTLLEFKNTDLSLPALKAWAERTRVPINRFPTLFACLRALEAGHPLAPDIDVFSLSDDVNEVREKIENTLAKTPQEKELVLLGRYTHLLTHLCLAEITPFEMERYQRFREQWRSIERTMGRWDPAMASMVRELDGEWRDMEDFYALARERDLAMTRNMERFLAGSGNATGTVCLAFAGLSPGILAVSQVLGAVALAGYSVTLNSLLYETLNGQGRGEEFKTVYGRAMQWFWIWMALSSFVGGWMASWIPLRGVILLSALVSVGLAGLIWTSLPTERPTGGLPRLTIAPSFIKDIVSRYATTGRQIFSSKKLRGLIFLSLFINGVFLSSVDFLTQPLLKDADLPLFLFGCLSVALNLTHAVSARYADTLEGLILRPGPRTAYFLMMWILLTGFITGESVLFLMAFLFSANFWQGLLFIVGPTQVHERLTDENRSSWFSLWNLLSAGTSVISFVFLSALLGWMSAPAALAILLLGAIAASWLTPFK